MRRVLALLILFIATAALAHEGHHHEAHTQEAKVQSAPLDLSLIYKLIYKEIDESYAKNVKPIFDQKCATCHSASNPSPWYSSLPVIHWLVESDRNEAKEHLEISKGFPFAGHGTPENDLAAIKEVITKNSMPTTLFALFHPSSRLSVDEKKIIFSWIEVSSEKLASATKMGNNLRNNLKNQNEKPK